MTVPDQYSVWHIAHFAHQLAGRKVFSTNDLVKRLPPDPSSSGRRCQDSHHYALRTLRVSVLSFGLRNAAQTFQRFIDEVLRDLDFCYAYIDDVLVTSTSEEDHEQHLRTLFQRFSDYGVLLNPAKSVFGATEVTFRLLHSFS